MKKIKKLSLSTSTIRQLVTDDLERVAGGVPTTGTSARLTCASACDPTCTANPTTNCPTQLRNC